MELKKTTAKLSHSKKLEKKVFQAACCYFAIAA